MGWFPPTVLKVVELVKTIVATGAMLKSFSPTALPAKGILIMILQWLDGARTPHKYHLGTT